MLIWTLRVFRFNSSHVGTEARLRKWWGGDQVAPRCVILVTHLRVTNVRFLIDVSVYFIRKRVRMSDAWDEVWRFYVVVLMVR